MNWKAELAERVAEMRRLGVIQYDGIIVGPEPSGPAAAEAAKPTEADERAAIEAAIQAERSIMYAAGVR